MNRNDLVKALTTTGRYTRETADQAITDVLATALNITTQGPLVLTGIGKFERVQRAPRIGRNPRTGESVQIPATTIVRFQPSAAVAEAVATGTTITGRRAQPGGER